MYYKGQLVVVGGSGLISIFFLACKNRLDSNTSGVFGDGATAAVTTTVAMASEAAPVVASATIVNVKTIRKNSAAVCFSFFGIRQFLWSEFFQRRKWQ